MGQIRRDWKMRVRDAAPYIKQGWQMAKAANEAYQEVAKFKETQKRIRDASRTTGESTVGYGVHDAKTTFSRRRRSTRKSRGKRRYKKAVQRSLNRKQKTLVRKIAKGKAPTYKTNSYQWHTVQAIHTGGVDDYQAFATKCINGLHPNMVKENDKANHFADLFNAVYLDADLTNASTDQQQREMLKKMKLYLKRSETKFAFTTSSTCPLVMIEMQTFVCKKSLKRNMLDDATERNTPADILGAPLDDLNDIHNAVFMPALLDRYGASVAADQFTVMSADMFGYNPRKDNMFLKEYFTHERTDRFEMGPSTQVNMDMAHKINMTMSANTAHDYGFLKGVTRLVVITARGAPYVKEDTTQVVCKGIPNNSDGDFGLTCIQTHRVDWKPVIHSPDQISDGLKELNALTTRGGYKDFGDKCQTKIIAI